MSDEKEVKILIVTEADLANAENLDELLEKAQANADNLSESISELDSTGLESASESADGLSSSTEEASTNADELNSSLSDIDGSGMDDAASSADNLAGSLDDAASSADETSNSLSTIESASLMGMAGEIQGYADGAENLAQQMNTAAISVGQLATNVGMAEPQMVSLINHISNATFPQEEAMAYVNVLNQMGVSADKLGDAATNMDKINDATHIGSDKVMLLTQGLQALGITADRLPESFNAIAYAQANVGGGADTLQQVLKRQAGTLNEYGMNIDATVVALSALQRETGLTGMKLGSEFGKRLKECNGDLKQLEQSLGMQPGALSNASAATSQYSGQLQALADEEAEHKSWLDQLNAAWEDMSLTLSPIISPLASLVGLFGQIGSTAMAANSIITLAQTLGILKTANEAATISQMELNLAFLTNPVFLVVAAIVALIAILAYLYYTNEDVRAAVDGLGQALWGIGETIYGALMGAFQWLTEQFQWLSDTFWGVVNTIQTYAPLVAQALFIMATGGVGAIVLLIMNFLGMPNQVGQSLQEVINRAIKFVTDIVNKLRDGARRAVDAFVGPFKGIVDAIAGELQAVYDTVMRFIQPIIDAFNTLGSAASWAFSILGLGQGSPGDIYRATKKELTYVEDYATGPGLRQMVKAGSVTGSALADSFNPDLGYSNNMIGGSSTGGVVGASYTFNLYGDIDNEDRMQRFVDAVRREIEWDNEKAGRTI